MGFAGGLAGLSAVSSGYDAAEKTAADTENTRAATEAQYQRLDEAQREADTKRQLDPILGRAFQHLMTGQVAPPQPPQNQPMAPPPGQPSMPGAQPMAPPQTGAPQGMPPPQQAAPHTPPPRNPETGAPEVNLQGVVKSIIAANPGIQSNPELFMRAISDPRVATILDRQGKEDLAELKSKYQQSVLDQRREAITLREQGLNDRAQRTSEDRRYSSDNTLAGRKYSADTILRARELSTDAQRDIAQLSATTRQEIADRAEIGKDNRAQLSDAAKREIATLNAQTRQEVVGMMEVGRNTRAATASDDRRYGVDTRANTAAAAEAGRDERNARGLEAKQLLNRLSDATKMELEQLKQSGSTDRMQLSIGAKREIAGSSDAARRELAQYLEEGRNGRAAAAQAGQNARNDERLDRTDRRLDQNDTREGRLSAGAAVRQDQGWQRLQLQKDALARRAVDSGDKNALGQWRAVVDAQHKLAMEKIQANSKISDLSEKDRNALLAEQTANYGREIAEMRTKMTGGTPAPAPGQPPVVAPAPGAPSAPTNAPPVSVLKAGVVTTFANGQKWTITPDGKPQQVQ